MADFYAKTARKVIEPSQDEILQAAKNYILCRKLMDEAQCDAITMDCLGLKDPVCVAFSKLLDEGIVATCERDEGGVLAQLITAHAFGRPGFIQDPSPNTVNNTLIGAHCTSPTKLKGFDDPYRAPFELRSYHTRTGASPQVFWPVGDDVTVIELGGSTTLLVGTGQVVSNIQQPPSGCCRTAVEITLDGATDTLNTKGFHQIFVWGNLERPLMAFGQLMGLAVKPICA